MEKKRISVIGNTLSLGNMVPVDKEQEMSTGTSARTEVIFSRFTFWDVTSR